MVNQDGSILQVQDYYAFGLEMNANNQVTPSPDNKYKYNGKEWNTESGLNAYDYGARFYDPVLGRWNVVDELAEMAYDWTPYRYGFNNPIRYIDPFGLWEEVAGGYKTDKKEDIDRFFSMMDVERSVLKNNPGVSEMSSFIKGEMSGGGLGTLSDGSKLATGFKVNAYRQVGGGIKGYADEKSFSTFWHSVQKDLTPDGLDTRTVGNNLLGLTYPGGNNPMTYSGKYSYSHVPQSLAEYPAIGHDRRYDNLGAAGLTGLAFDSRTVGADWRFVGQQMTIASMSVSMRTRIQAAVLGTGLGAIALPKTLGALASPQLGLSYVQMWDSIGGIGVTNTPSK